MLRRLSAFFATLALATGLSVAATAPAQAAGGSCHAISVAGDADASTTYNWATQTSSYRLSVNDLVGSTGTSCSSSSYKYDLVFERGGDGENHQSWTVSSTGNSYSPYTGKTTVSFPNTLLAVPSGKGTLQLTIKTWVYAPAYGVWFSSESDSRTVFLRVPDHFDTATGEGITTQPYCWAPPGTSSPLGYNGWC